MHPGAEGSEVVGAGLPGWRTGVLVGLGVVEPAAGSARRVCLPVLPCGRVCCRPRPGGHPRPLPKPWASALRAITLGRGRGALYGLRTTPRAGPVTSLQRANVPVVMPSRAKRGVPRRVASVLRRVVSDPMTSGTAHVKGGQRRRGFADGASKRRGRDQGPDHSPPVAARTQSDRHWGRCPPKPSGPWSRSAANRQGAGDVEATENVKGSAQAVIRRP